MPYVEGTGLDTQKICLEGTRTEILDEITAWINNTEDNASRVFLLHGGAGTGKSFIAHTIAHRFDELGRLGSCYCFDRNVLAQQRDKKIFATIARDLADRDEQVRRKLAGAIHLNTSLKYTTDILQQWKELIMKPARALSESMVGPVVIIIDALDESGEPSSRQLLLRILAGKLRDDESHIVKLPPHF
jgi:DNA replication protein DnaC